MSAKIDPELDDILQKQLDKISECLYDQEVPKLISIINLHFFLYRESDYRYIKGYSTIGQSRNGHKQHTIQISQKMIVDYKAFAEIVSQKLSYIAQK